MLSKKDKEEKACIQAQVKAFLNDPSMNKITIAIPPSFCYSWVVSPFAYAYRKTLFFLQQWIVPSRFKNALLRTTGMNIGDDVCIPHYIYFDPYFPQLISIGEGSIVGGLSKLYTHQKTATTLTLGRVQIKEKVLIAGFSTIYPGVTVHSYTITGIQSHITQDCPEKSFVVGNDKVLKQWSDEELQKYFGESKNDPNYYKEFKQKVKAFRKNKTMMVVRIPYHGKRKNAGNEWYLARPWPRIYYNAFFVELARISPWQWLRKLLLRCLGAKIGKNVWIGKGVVFDHIYGDLVTIEDDVVIGDYSYLDGHSYTISETIFGRVHIGKGSQLGPYTNVMCGVKIGKNCTILGPATVLKDVPDNETWAGNPAKKIEG